MLTTYPSLSFSHIIPRLLLFHAAHAANMRRRMSISMSQQIHEKSTPDNSGGPDIDLYTIPSSVEHENKKIDDNGINLKSIPKTSVNEPPLHSQRTNQYEENAQNDVFSLSIDPSSGYPLSED